MKIKYWVYSQHLNFNFQIFKSIFNIQYLILNFQISQYSIFNVQFYKWKLHNGLNIAIATMRCSSVITFVPSFDNAVILIREGFERVEIAVDDVIPLTVARTFSVCCYSNRYYFAS